MPEGEGIGQDAQPGLFPAQNGEESVATPPDAPPAAAPPTAAPPPLAPADRIADGRERSLDPDSVTLERITRGIFAAVFGAMTFVPLIALLLGTGAGPLPRALLLLAWCALALFFAVLAWFWPPLRYRHVSYVVDERGIRIRRGVVWRSRVSIPQSRVQHTDVSQGPIERSFGLATLIIHTAGTHHASVSLGGLRREDALRIRDHLIEGNEPDAV